MPPFLDPAYQLFWDLREFRGWRRSEKNRVCCAPPPFLKFLDPPLGLGTGLAASAAHPRRNQI